MPPGSEEQTESYVPLLQRVAPNAYEATPDPLEETMTEAPPAKTEEAGADMGGEGTARGRTTIKGEQDLGARTTGAKPGQWQASVQLGPGTAPDTAMAIRAREDRIHQQQVLQNLVEMRKAGLTRDQMTLWANLNDMDAARAQEIASTQIPLMRKKVQELQTKVDEARSLKVDPYHWHESIGRGGRVAAAFAALTGGFAAGKSNPNSAVNMMDAAIERDIAAQENNIRNNIQLLQLNRGLAQDERQLLEDELATMSQIRATKYAAIVGRIKAAQQHALTEAHHMALQTVYDHYELKYLHAKAAAEQEIFKLTYEGPVKNASEIARLQQEADAYQRQIRSDASGGMTIPIERVQTLEGDVSGPRPEAAIRVARAAPAPGRSGAVAGRGRGRARGVAPGGPAEGQAGTQPAPAIPEGAVAQDSEGQYLDAGGNVLKAQAPKAEKAAPRVNSQNITQWAGSDPEVAAHPEAVKHDSYARAHATGKKGQDVNVGITTWTQAARDIEAEREIRNGGMADHRDAKVVKEMMRQNGPPQPGKYKGGADNIHYKEAVAAWERVQRYPSILETNTYDQETGEKSKITLNGRMFTIIPGSRGKEDYARISEEVLKYRDGIGALKNAADTIRRVGLTGMWEADEDGKTSFTIPGMFTNENPDVLVLTREAIAQAMQFIKTHDPTARISDQDLKVGMQAAASYANNGAKFVDWIQSMFNVDTKRKQIVAFMGKVAVEAQRILYQRLEGDIVPDYNTSIMLENEYQANNEFLKEAHRR